MTSAKDNFGIEEIFEKVVDQILENRKCDFEKQSPDNKKTNLNGKDPNFAKSHIAPSETEVGLGKGKKNGKEDKCKC